METTGLDKMVRQLSAGFETLQDEYRKLYGQHQLLEKKLATAREQYNELAKLCGSRQTNTPPLSLSSIPGPTRGELPSPISASEILDKSSEIKSREAASVVRAADAAARLLRNGLPPYPANTSHGVKIWSGPSADKPEAPASSMMPSISESPLEQDFTVEGKPSKLGCPFSGMASKKLSSHAASVLSRYNRSNSVGAVSTRTSSVSRVDGRESLIRRQRHGSSGDRRESFVDPIRAEICGMAEAHEGNNDATVEGRPALTRVPSKSIPVDPATAEERVCPIRFLDQHSPEEVATYFENHKHELPRSHEWCVLRYQSNEDQIRELDAKYGNLVSMIQGLGAKHKDMLPDEPQDDDEEDEEADDEAGSHEKVRKWAHSVSAQAVDGNNLDDGNISAVESKHDADDDDSHRDSNEDDDSDERQSHFARPLRDIRVGESPSRPWGIPVPAKYLEKAESVTSSQPVEVAHSRVPIQHRNPATASASKKATSSGAKCPFPQLGASASPPAPAPGNPDLADPSKAAPPSGGKCPFDHGAATKPDAQHPGKSNSQFPPKVTTTSPESPMKTDTHANATPELANNKEQNKTGKPPPRTDAPVIINGPVFIGYSADDAIRFLRECGLQMSQA